MLGMKGRQEHLSAKIGDFKDPVRTTSTQSAPQKKENSRNRQSKSQQEIQQQDFQREWRKKRSVVYVH